MWPSTAGIPGAGPRICHRRSICWSTQAIAYAGTANPRAVIPSAVGVDIGCGMIAAELPLDSHALPDDLTELHDRIRTVVPAGVGRGRDGVVFVPFHYGYWDRPGGAGPDGRGRAANELTLTDWDPCSKQPIFKTAAANATRLAPGDGPAAAPTTTGSRPVAGDVPPTRGGAAAEAVEELATGGAR